jgi:hypothetical protein
VRKRIFGYETEEVAGKWTKLHNEEIHSSKSSPKFIKREQIKEGADVARTEEMRKNLHHFIRKCLREKTIMGT